MRKGNNVLYMGELYKVHQKRGEAVTIYNPRAKYPEATMITTSIYKVQPATDKFGYRVSSYKTESGHVRVLIFQINDTFPMLDIPAREAETHMSEIRTSTCGRAWFIDYREKDHEPDTTTGAQDGHTGSEITTTGADKAPEEATTRPERPTTAESTTAGETPTTAETAPQDATSDAGPAADHAGTPAAETAPEGPEISTATQDTTGSDTRPPRAQEANQEPGHAAGDHTGPAADHITGPGTAAGDYTGPTTGNTSGAAAEAITGRTTTPPQNPGHACENAPGRTERAQAEQVHTPHAKRPPRAPQRATTHGQPRGQPEKAANFGRFYPLLDFPRTIFANFQGVPISVCIFGPVFDPKFWSPKPDPPGGYQNLLQSPAKKFSKNIFRWR